MGTVLGNSQLWSVSRGAGALPLQGPFQLPTAGSVPSKGCGRAAGMPCCRGGDGGRTRVWVLERGVWARLQKAEQIFGIAEDKEGQDRSQGWRCRGLWGDAQPQSPSWHCRLSGREGECPPACCLPGAASRSSQVCTIFPITSFWEKSTVIAELLFHCC